MKTGVLHAATVKKSGQQSVVLKDLRAKHRLVATTALADVLAGRITPTAYQEAKARQSAFSMLLTADTSRQSGVLGQAVAAPTLASPAYQAALEQGSAQIGAAEAELAWLLPLSPFATLPTTPGWGVVRAGNYGGALGDPHRWPGPSQIYRASGLSPAQYESAGKRRDGSISREGSVALRRAWWIWAWGFGSTTRPAGRMRPRSGRGARRAG